MVNQKGTSSPWKTHKAVSLAFDFHARSCVSCGEVFLNGKEIKELDIMLKKSLEVHQS